MKILFLYTKMDKALQEKMRKLKENHAEVSTLSLLEYKLEENSETQYLEPPSKLEFLEKNSTKLRVLNRIFKRKKLLGTLDDYDIIEIYKCEKSALFIVDEIQEKCYDFFVSVAYQAEEDNVLNKPFYKYLYKKAKFLIFDNQDMLDDFPYQHPEKSRFIPDSIPLLEEMDNISEEEIFKTSHAMGFDMDRDIIYADLSGSLQTQMDFIDDILTLPIERLRQSTFIFHLNQHNLEERQALKKHFAEKNFDYLLIDTLITQRQRALLYKIADKSIILSTDKENQSLPLSLYAKNHTYLYGDIMIDTSYKETDVFLSSFEDFKNQSDEENPIISDLIQANQAKIYTLFNPDEIIGQYIEMIKEI